MNAIANLITTVISLYIWILIASAIMSWLIAFKVVNTYNRVVASIAEVLYRLTEPVLAPIRRVLPTMGGLDLSPIVLILLLYFLRDLVIEYFPR
jgi:YggT family protein